MAINFRKPCCSKSTYSRSLLAKLRTRILQLRVETGRYTQLKFDERTCLICNTNSIHFVCECKTYDELKRHLYEKVFEKDGNFYNLTAHEKFPFL